MHQSHIIFCHFCYGNDYSCVNSRHHTATWFGQTSDYSTFIFFSYKNLYHKRWTTMRCCARSAFLTSIILSYEMRSYKWYCRRAKRKTWLIADAEEFIRKAVPIKMYVEELEHEKVAHIQDQDKSLAYAKNSYQKPYLQTTWDYNLGERLGRTFLIPFHY